MKISNNGINLIKSFEKLRLKAYKPTKAEKKYTVGYGHYGVSADTVITEKDAEALLRMDIGYAEDELNKLKIDFNQNQFDALCSFIFNVGVGNFKNSTMYRRLSQGNKNIADQFGRWVYQNGIVLKGLVRRRAQEAQLYQTPV